MQNDKDAKKEAPKTPEVVKPSPPPVFPGLDPAAARQAKEFKHTSALLACRYEPSGKFLFTSGQDNTLQRWEIATAKKTDMAGHSSWVRAMVFAPKQKLLFSGGYDGQIISWNYESAEPIPLRQVLAHQGWIRSLSVDPTGQMLVSCANDGRIAIWSIPELKPVHSWQAHENHAYQVAFHPSGKEIVSVDLKGVVRIWDLTGKKIREIEAKALHKYDAGFGADIGGARSMAFSTDGTVLALAGITNVTNAFAGIGNPIILLVDWATGKITKELTPKEKFQGTMWGVAWHPAGFVVGTAGGNGGMLWFWKPDQPNEFAAIKLADNSRDISIAPNGKAVAIPSYGGFARIFDITPNLNPPKEAPPKVPPAKK